AGRGRAEIEGLIGFFVSSLALRIDLSGDITGIELLDRVKHQALEAQQHQDLPFEQVVEIVQPPRRLSHTPVFQVMFAWQNTEQAVFDLPDLVVQSVEVELTRAKFDLELTLAEAGDRIAGAFGYATSLFDEATIVRHLG